LLAAVLGTASNYLRIVPNNLGKDGEYFIETCCLYLNPLYGHQNLGEQNQKSSHLYLNPVCSLKTLENKLSNNLSCT
jgi:hypothetical protein